MQSLHGQGSVAGAAIALEDAVVPTYSPMMTATPTPIPMDGDTDNGVEVHPRVPKNSMPTLALRFSENVRKLYNTSLRYKKSSINWHGFEGGLRNVSVTNLDSIPVSNTQWLSEYLHGVSMELYSARFSAAFEGLTFAEAAKLCMKKLELMLIAILAQSTEEEKDDGVGQYPYLVINPPSTPHSLIHEGTIGFFICDSQVSDVCPHLTTPTYIKIVDDPIRF